MKDTRKDIRIRLPESAVDAFAQAKAKAEAELGITLKDGEFATRVLVHNVCVSFRGKERVPVDSRELEVSAKRVDK